MIFVIYRPINEISVVEQNGIYGQQRLETPDYTPAAHQQFICSDISGNTTWKDHNKYTVFFNFLKLFSSLCANDKIQ